MMLFLDSGIQDPFFYSRNQSSKINIAVSSNRTFILARFTEQSLPIQVQELSVLIE